MMKTTILVGALFCACSSFAGTINVTSPGQNDFLGKSNQLSFTITGSNAQARVLARVTNIADSSISFSFQQDFTPDVNHEIEGNLNLNFNDTTPEGNYRVVVTVTEAGNTYNTVTINPVVIDVVNPKFRDFAPANAAFVRGVVNIFALIEEPNVDLWKVQINGQDIPNNTGSGATVSVNWNTSSIIRDGSQNISIKVDDKAKNTNTRSIAVTLDRISPTIEILAPTSTPYRPNSALPVIIDFRDQFSGALLAQSVDVLIRDMNNNLLGRVPRRSIRPTGGTLQWTGRIQNTRNLPRQFKLVVSAVDRAGNPAVNQEVIVNLSGRRR